MYVYKYIYMYNLHTYVYIYICTCVFIHILFTKTAERRHAHDVLPPVVIQDKYMTSIKHIYMCVYKLQSQDTPTINAYMNKHKNIYR